MFLPLPLSFCLSLTPSLHPSLSPPPPPPPPQSSSTSPSLSVYSVQVIDVCSNTVKVTLPRPKTRCLQFSPQGTYLALWEPYVGRDLFLHIFSAYLGQLIRTALPSLRLFPPPSPSLPHTLPFLSLSLTPPAQKDQAGQPNLEVWDTHSSEKVVELIHKRQQGW